MSLKKWGKGSFELGRDPEGIWESDEKIYGREKHVASFLDEKEKERRRQEIREIIKKISTEMENSGEKPSWLKDWESKQQQEEERRRQEKEEDAALTAELEHLVKLYKSKNKIQKPSIYTYQQKKQQLIKIFPEISSISEEDVTKIIELYEQEVSKERTPSNSDYDKPDNLILIDKIYEVIKNNSKYNEITEKAEEMFLNELNMRLERTEPTHGTSRASYAEMPQYSLTLIDMCSRKIKDVQKNFEEYEATKLVNFYEEIKKDFSSAGIEIPKKSEDLVQIMKDLIKSSQEEKERERQQREAEMLQLQNEISKLENEILQMKERINEIRNVVNPEFSLRREVSERYPNEYECYVQSKEQLEKHKSSNMEITDLKSKFELVSQESQFFNNIISAYELFYYRFEQVQSENEEKAKQEKAVKEEQRRIYNLIYSEWNQELKSSSNLYDAWDFGTKVIPAKYQGMSYEQVEAMIAQEKEEQRLKNEAKEIREDLIKKAIRKELGVSEDYRLKNNEIQNLRINFDGKTNEELQEFISEPKKEIVISETTETSKVGEATPAKDATEDQNLIMEQSEEKIVSSVQEEIPVVENINVEKARPMEAVSTSPNSSVRQDFSHSQSVNGKNLTTVAKTLSLLTELSTLGVQMQIGTLKIYGEFGEVTIDEFQVNPTLTTGKIGKISMKGIAICQTCSDQINKNSQNIAMEQLLDEHLFEENADMLDNGHSRGIGGFVNVGTIIVFILLMLSLIIFALD